ncbi:PAS domain-containing sensor histidine kinase [Desulfoplanes formicivorans]|uniref:histidine kinase n=1 Tax=Desulfoplanes formicivorans TaxID=1592317 RepID=A0A194AKX9_9BACT|nr:PAS domain-containing sensor histidine kinase [Desulfoplanes formicivorans]GAU09900.1 hypothetical protein DPF_2636 [Desulfoplanes formicivorans]
MCDLDDKREQQRQLLESIYYGASTAMFVIEVTEDGDFRYAGLNPAHTRISGLSEAQVVGRTPEELVPLITPDIAAGLRANYERCLSAGTIIEYEECLPLQGREIWWLTRLNPLVDESGSIYRIIGCSTDITRQKKTEKELAEHRGQLQKRTADEVRKLLRAVEESPASVVITDSHGNIEYVNPKFCTVTGYQAEEVLGQNPRILKAGIQDGDLYQDMWLAISSGREWKGEFCNRKKNGELYWERASISPLQDPDGTITHYVAVKEDITEEKRMAQELERAMEMAQVASRAKSDFLASMSHELRTPLNSIIGFSEVLREQYFGPLNAKQLEYVEDVLSSGRHLLALINDILDIAKIESGKQVLQQEVVDIVNIVETGMVMIREKAAHHAIRIQTRFCKKCREQGLYADKRKLKQALFNILSNAVKFTPDGGSIEIAVDFVDPDAGDVAFPAWFSPDMASAVTRPSIVISVSDTGVGIAAEDLAHVFEPFYQTREGALVKTPSSGLGLPITREIMILHGGNAWAMSDGPGRGSRFVLQLPFVPEDRQECECPDNGGQ